jgi:hypothetical protein
MSLISSAMLARKNCVYMWDNVVGNSAQGIAANRADMDGLIY